MRLKNILLSLAVITASAQDLTVQVDGKRAGVARTLNLVPGFGIVHTCEDKPDQHRVDCTPSLNTAVIATHDTVHANENYCASSNGTTSYTCRLPYKALVAYRAGMTFVVNVDTTCAAACSLNIDKVGAVAIRRSDGTENPRGALVAGQPQWVFYDGTVFRLMGGEALAPGDQRGDVRARRLIASMATIPYQASMTVDSTAGDVHRVRTAPNGGNANLNTSSGGLAGQHMWIIITNDNVSPKTISFGGNLLNSGPLTGKVGKSSTIHFVSDGSAWFEVSRTVGL